MNLENLINNLDKRWAHCSRFDRMLKDSDAIKIINMGEKAVPTLLKILAEKPNHAALLLLARTSKIEPVIPDESRGKFYELVRICLEAHGIK